MLKGLNIKQKLFAREYVFDWNATRAYKKVYGTNLSERSAEAMASKLLSKVIIQDYITEIQQDVGKLCNVSKSRVLEEYKKIAFTSIAHLHKTWIDRVDFEKLTDEQKACIQEINTRIVKRNIGTLDEPEIVDVEMIQIKLYDKRAALADINKMLGFNEPEKKQLGGLNGESLFPEKVQHEYIPIDRKPATSEEEVLKQEGPR